MNNTAAANLIATQSTPALVLALLALEPKVAARTLSPEERIARAWMIEAIEARHDVAAAMDAWADEDDYGMTYVEALLAALPMEAVA